MVGAENLACGWWENKGGLGRVGGPTWLVQQPQVASRSLEDAIVPLSALPVLGELGPQEQREPPASAPSQHSWAKGS